MPNIATLGLEFKADKATERIQKLCDKFDELSKKTDNIQDVFNSLSQLKPLNNTFVTQISAVGNALNSLNKIKPEIATKISAITNAIAAMPYMSLDGATKIAAFAQSLNGIKIDAATSQTFHDISGLMANLRPVPPTVSDSLHQFASAVNSIQPIKPEIVQSIQAVMSVSSSVGGTATGQQDLNALADTLKKFKGIKPEVAVSIKELFNTLESVKNIDANTTQSIANLGDATRKFQAIKPTITVSVEKLFSAMGYLPNIDADKANAIANLGDATRKFQAIKPDIAKSVEHLFQTIAQIKNIPYNITDNVQKLGEALHKFKAIKPEVAQSVKNLFDTLSALKPVSANLRISIQMLTNMFNAMAAAGANVSKVTRELGSSMGYASTQSDGLSIAFRSLQGAISLNFFKTAIQDATDLGVELAQIKSVASELNTEKIGKGVMNFSSVLGSPKENLESLYYAYSSGIRGTEDDFVKFTEQIQKTAQVARASVMATNDAVTSAMNAYGLSVDRAGEVTDTLYAIVKYGKATGEQLANSFGQVTPTARTLGLSLNELGASIASLTKIQPTRVAITGLNNMLSKILKPTKESRLALQKLGVDMSYSAVQSKGFKAVMTEVREALNGNAEALKNIFPDIRGQRAAMHLLGEGWKDFQEQLDNFDKKKGSMEQAFQVLTKDTAVQIAAIPQSIKKIVTEAGTMITKFLTLGGVLTPVIAGFNNMSEGARKFFAGITLVVGAYTAYKSVMFAVQSIQAIQVRNEQALAAAQARKNAQLAEEVALRMKLLGLSAGNKATSNPGFSSLAGSRAGFSKGFDAAMNSGKWNKSWENFAAAFTTWGKGISPTTKRLLHLRVVSRSLMTAWTGLGAVLGKVVATIGAIFSPLGLAIAGIGTAVAGIIDIGQAMIRSGSFTNYGDKLIATDAIEKIYNWWTGTADKAKALDEYISATRASYQALNENIRSFKAFVVAVEEFSDSLKQKTEVQKSTQLAEITQKRLTALQEDAKAHDALLSEQKKITETQKQYNQNLQEARNASLNNKKEWTKLIAAAVTPGTFNLAFKQAKAMIDASGKIDEAEAKAAEINKQAAAKTAEVASSSEKITKNLELTKEAWEKQREFLQQQIANIKEIQNIFSGQALKEMSADDRIKTASTQFANSAKEYKDAISKGETALGKEQLQMAQKNYNMVRDNAIKIGEDMAKLQFEGLMMGASDSQKLAIYTKESGKAFAEMQTALKGNNLNAASKALSSYIQHTKDAVAIQNRLADAERQANQKTLQMTLALDKFKVTAMEMVDVNSTEAMKLQSRQFDALPSYQPLSNQQTAAADMNKDLAAKIAEYTAKIQAQAEAERQAAEAKWKDMENATNQRLADLEEQKKKELEEFQKKLSAIVEELKKLPTVNETISNNVQKIANQGVTLKNVNGKKATS